MLPPRVGANAPPGAPQPNHGRPKRRPARAGPSPPPPPPPPHPRRVADRRRRFWGILVFSLAGMTVLTWLVFPLLGRLADSPAEWINLALAYLVFLVSSVQTFTEVGSVFLRVVPGFVPPLVWMALASVAAGVSLLWTVSIWRFTRVPRGV